MVTGNQAMGQVQPSCKQARLPWSWKHGYRDHKSSPEGQSGEGEKEKRDGGEERWVTKRKRERKRGNRKNEVKEWMLVGNRASRKTHTHTPETEVRKAGKGPPPDLPHCSHSSSLSCSQPFGILATAGTSCPRKLIAPWPLGGPSCCSGPCSPLR